MVGTMEVIDSEDDLVALVALVCDVVVGAEAHLIDRESYEDPDSESTREYNQN